MLRQRTTGTLIVNFGGPRELEEIPSFLTELLTDIDVIRTSLPGPIQRFLFKRIAQRRAKKVSSDYVSIGGRSPIFAETEKLAEAVGAALEGPTYTFHRYLPATHPSFLDAFSQEECTRWKIFPCFPQFSFATTGSIARWMKSHLPKEQVQQMRWVKSYPTHPLFIRAFQEQIASFMTQKELDPKSTFLLYTAHGLPQSFVTGGDPYSFECEESYLAIQEAFPESGSLLAYQSKFGPGEWLRPYTSDVVKEVKRYVSPATSTLLLIPLAFTSDHLETLYEIEQEYLPPIREAGFAAHRVPALGLNPLWIKAIPSIIQESALSTTEMLIRSH